MIVVILIITVTLTMVSVSLSGATGGVAVKESSSRLMAALRYAHYYAAVHGRECRVVFSRQNNAYDLSCRADDDGSDQEKFEALVGGAHAALDAHVQFAAIVIQPGGDHEPVQDAITFRPTGEADAAIIEITDGRMIYTISVSPNSGLVQLHKGPAREIPSDREDLDA